MWSRQKLAAAWPTFWCLLLLAHQSHLQSSYSLKWKTFMHTNNWRFLCTWVHTRCSKMSSILVWSSQCPRIVKLRFGPTADRVWSWASLFYPNAPCAPDRSSWTPWGNSGWQRCLASLAKSTKANALNPKTLDPLVELAFPMHPIPSPCYRSFHMQVPQIHTACQPKPLFNLSSTFSCHWLERQQFLMAKLHVRNGWWKYIYGMWYDKSRGLLLSH